MSDQSALEDSWDRERKLVERIAELEEELEKSEYARDMNLAYCNELRVRLKEQGE